MHNDLKHIKTSQYKFDINLGNVPPRQYPVAANDVTPSALSAAITLSIGGRVWA